MTEGQLEYGKWWSGFMWDHFVTLTVDPHGGRRVGRAGRCPRTPAGVAKAMQNEFHRLLTKLVGGRVPFVGVIGLGAGDNPHAHLLTYGTAAIPLDRMARGWRHGRVTVERYDPMKGAAYYLAKHIGEEANWEMSKTLPPLRSGALITPYSPNSRIQCQTDAK